ncbi:hypothetical protein Celaphus_00014706 [Cervus elaphus hippelaphus]|uniref:Uncharacterized protein n=1 Tax=Cervus elaphus hippelaphus TaxID=46360 RepID=A0A212D3Q4_CEREH|nr:hypothetical protein Celaphus_00014706 [Cervus elaphus hippelaphus]
MVVGLGRMPRLRAGSWIWWGEEEEGTGVWGAPSEVQLGAGARAGPAGPPSDGGDMGMPCLTEAIGAVDAQGRFAR